MSGDFTVLYDPDRDPVVVHSPGELDALLQRILADREYIEVPTLAEITGPDEQAVLYVGLGYPDVSVLKWQRWDENAPEALISAGTAAVTGSLEYDFGGTVTTMSPETTVPLETALQAARQFVETGTRPGAVRWTRMT